MMDDGFIIDMSQHPTLNTQHLQTEQRNPRTNNLDQLSTDELARALHSENYLPAEAVEAALPDIAQAIDVIAERLRAGGRLFYIWAGKSGRIGVAQSDESPPPFGTRPGN